MNKNEKLNISVNEFVKRQAENYIINPQDYAEPSLQLCEDAREILSENE
jgi:hypothetical protein